jgi:hypothetical protein
MISRLIKIEKRPTGLEFQATDSNMQNTRGIASRLNEGGFVGNLYIHDCTQLPIDTNSPDDVASLLDISTGRLGITVSVSTTAILQKRTDFPQIDAPWN